MFANLKRKVLVGSVTGLILFGGALPLFVSQAHAQGPVTTPPAATETIEAPKVAGAPEAGEVAEAKGADLDAIQAGPGQQLEQQGGSTLDGNF
jgi:hypothetical protein